MTAAFATIVKTLNTGAMKIASRLCAWLRKLAPKCSGAPQMNDKLTSEQLEARSKFIIVMAFAFILVMIAFTLVYSVTWVEQPMSSIAPADKYNYEIIKLIAVQIFSVLAILLGAKVMTPSAPPAPKIEEEDDVKPN